LLQYQRVRVVLRMTLMLARAQMNDKWSQHRGQYGVSQLIVGRRYK